MTDTCQSPRTTLGWGGGSDFSWRWSTGKLTDDLGPERVRFPHASINLLSS